VGRCSPTAHVAILGGGSVAGEITSTSDLDIVIVLAGSPAPKRITTIWESVTVETFLHTHASLNHYWEIDLADGKPSLLRMCADGVVLDGEERSIEAVRAEARRRLDAGPAESTPGEIDRRRYGITDLIDDLVGGVTEVERPFVVGQLATDVASLALVAARHWRGGGKWLGRELFDLDPDLARDLVAAHSLAVGGSDGDLIRVAEAVLDRVGGRLLAGYEADGEMPPTTS
jgi:hypothetical protein